jgi:hypothetical protein
MYSTTERASMIEIGSKKEGSRSWEVDFPQADCGMAVGGKKKRKKKK